MTLIKCPKCDHTVLSAASRCPGCGSAMDPQQRDAIRVNRPRRFWPLIFGLSVLALLVAGMWRAQSERARAIAMSIDRLVNESSPEPKAAPETASAPPDKTQLGPAAVRDAGVARTQPVKTQEPAPADTDTLWTRTWVNVRERPGTTSTVVQVLTPGKPVAVVNPERQWSLVYVDGRQVGYLSVALLATQPPTP